MPYTNNIYMKAFVKDLSLRPSCYSCAFKEKNRSSDITLADFWGVENLFPDIKTEKGISLVLVNSAKASALFNELNIEFKSVKSIDEAIAFNASMIKSPQRPARRESYIYDVLNFGYDGINEKYFKISRTAKIKNKCKRFLKTLLKR